MAGLTMAEGAAPGTPSAGQVILYMKADGFVYAKDDAGVERKLTNEDVLSVALGGTGGASHTAYAVLCGGTTGTGALQSVASVGTAGQVLTSAGAGALPTFSNPTPFTLGTPVATTSGTSIDFTSIPSGTKQIIATATAYSTSGTSNPILQLGDSGGVENTGYAGSNGDFSPVVVNLSSGFLLLQQTAAAGVMHAVAILTLQDSSTNTWTCLTIGGRSDLNISCVCIGTKSLSSTLDRVRLTTVGGTDTFDAGKMNITYG